MLSLCSSPLVESGNTWMLYWAWMFYKKHASWNIPFEKIEMMDKFPVTPIFCYHCSEGQISSRNCCSCEDSYNILVAACLRLRRTRFATLQFPPSRSRVPETRNYSAWQPAEVNELRQSFKITFFFVKSINALCTSILSCTKDAAQHHHPRRAKLASLLSYNHCFLFPTTDTDFPLFSGLWVTENLKRSRDVPSRKKTPCSF